MNMLLFALTCVVVGSALAQDTTAVVAPVAPAPVASATDSLIPVSSSSADSTIVPSSSSQDSLVVAESSSSEQIALSSSEQIVDSTESLSVSSSSIEQSSSSIEVIESSSSALSSSSIKIEVSYTEIGGEINGFLTAAKSPYKVTSSLVVSENQALVIDAGVELYFAAGSGLDIRGGAFAAIGNEERPVKMLAADSTKLWEGVRLTGEVRGDFNNVSIEGARTAIALENAGADILHASVAKSQVGISLRNSNAKFLNVKIHGNKAGTIISKGSFVSIDNVDFTKNETALVASENTEILLSNVNVSDNNLGILDMENNIIKDRSLKVEKNEIGIASVDILPENLRAVTANNSLDVSNAAKSLYLNLPEVAENPYAMSYRASAAPLIQAAELPRTWLLTGNVSTEIGYHLVFTNHNHTNGSYIFGTDTVAPGERYENYFKVPGLYSRYNTYMKLTSPEGRTFEFSTDVESDQWNSWNVHNVNLTYTDETRKVVLGDMFLNGGEIYMNGLNLFGAAYTTGYLKKDDGRHVFETTVFAGETNKPKLLGDDNPDVYNDVIQDGEAEVQNVVAGGRVTWNMHKRFSGALGFIGSESYKEDPYFRDGMSERVNTIDPEISSRTFFAEGNWLFWPGDIELNGQIAFGAADTSDVQAQRAIDRVFTAAGLSVENFALLRKLMKEEELVSTLSRNELEEIFGDNSTMTLSEMREQLRSLLRNAREISRSYEKRDGDPSEISGWDGQNIAALAGFRWGIGRTTLSGHFKYVGSKFYSAGSPDQLSNSRQIDFAVDQRLFDFWRLSLGYELNVENAASGEEYNVLGSKEGSVSGLPFESTSSWEREHADDEDRALFIHDIVFRNSFKLSLFDVSLKYKLNLRDRNRAIHLYSDYRAESGVLRDPWFAPSGDNSVYAFNSNGDTVRVDSARFDQYYDLRDEPFLASGFEERLLKHSVELELSLKLNKHIVRFGGVWIYRDDLSKFRNDDLLEDFEFKNETYGYLGYYFHGADFFEQRYPVSWSANYERWNNHLSFVPRFKSYNRDDMTEFEWSLNESFEMVLIKNRLEMSINGEIRQEFVSRDKGSDESEADLNASGTVTVHYTKDLSSDYTIGGYYCYRPDSRADQYKDIFASFSLNYAF